MSQGCILFTLGTKNQVTMHGLLKMFLFLANNCFPFTPIVIKTLHTDSHEPVIRSWCLTFPINEFGLFSKICQENLEADKVLFVIELILNYGLHVILF